MKTGMLWFDDDRQRTLAEKIERAATYYQQKYKAAPSVCYVHPTALDGVEAETNGVELRTATLVRPDHFWLGVEEPQPKPNGRRAA